MVRVDLTGIVFVSIALAHAAVPGTGRDIIWRNPGNVAARDLAWGPGGKENRPRPPFQFIEEDRSGTSPKVLVKDATGRKWSVKWGWEAWASTFSSHFVWGCGYVVETEYFVPRGRILGAHDLRRTKDYIDTDGAFQDARFQLRSSWPKFMKDRNWSWVDNPFVGTHEFNGLRILMMLLSNWDAKDARDLHPGSHSKTADSNLAVFQERGTPPRYLYFVSDWGATMGKASARMGNRDKWDPQRYTAQTSRFVRKVTSDGEVVFGFRGKRGRDVAQRITVGDVRWLMRYLGQITDQQIHRDLIGSGATPEEESFFAPALRERIRQLQAVAALRQLR